MAFSSGSSSITQEELLSLITEAEILNLYLGITEVPKITFSPLRIDKNPSFSYFSPDGIKIKWKDFGTNEGGNLYELLSRLWGIPYQEVIQRIYKDIEDKQINNKVKFKNKLDKYCNVNKISNVELQCKIREWRDYDLEYWKSYGISLEWLKYAEVYPISHKIIIKNGKRYAFGADKYAYAYVERKEGKITLKIYQPFNKEGFKWSNNHNSSVISLWTKIPKTGDKICICASLKDALCLYCNTGIPSIALQGEGYNISQTVVEELKKRFKEVYILFDNDKEGLKDGTKLSEITGFTNIILPEFNYGKDVSDYYKYLNDPEVFKFNILQLFNKQT